MPDLMKTRTVLVRNKIRTRAVLFATEPDGGLERRTSLLLDLEVWADMGRPTQITVTIEPGDLLNADQS